MNRAQFIASIKKALGTDDIHMDGDGNIITPDDTIKQPTQEDDARWQEQEFLKMPKHLQDAILDKLLQDDVENAIRRLHRLSASNSYSKYMSMPQLTYERLAKVQMQHELENQLRSE